MPEAPRRRPEHAIVLHEFRGHIKARPKVVFEAIAARENPGRDAASLYTADPAAFLVISQGGWWYRAEYRVIPDARGSNLELTILNVSDSPKPLGRFSGGKILEEAPVAFDRLLKGLRAELEG